MIRRERPGRVPGPAGPIPGRNGPGQGPYFNRPAKGGYALLGIASTELALAYLLCIAASLLCVVYGILKWNDTGPLSDELKILAAEQDDAPSSR